MSRSLADAHVVRRQCPRAHAVLIDRERARGRTTGSAAAHAAATRYLTALVGDGGGLR